MPFLFYGSRWTNPSVERVAGQKSYELKDHLGNVRTVVLPASNSNTSIGSGVVYRMDKNQTYTNQIIKLDGGVLLVEGSTDFQISNLNLELKSGKVYISKGAKVKIPNLNLNTPANSLLEVINVGELVSENVNLNGQSRLVNGGKLTVNQTLSVNDAKAVVVNQDTLTVQNGLSSVGQIENRGFLEVNNNQVSLNGGSYVGSTESKLKITGNLTIGNVSLQGPIQAGVYALIVVGGSVTINSGGSAPQGNVYLQAIGRVSGSQSELGKAILTPPSVSITQVLAAAQLRANVLSYASYLPFGMLAPSLEWHKVGYRWGYNGKEIDREGMGGGGSTYDYGFRIYNPNIAKFLSVDPIASSFPWWSPYHFASNSPILFIDVDGLEGGQAEMEVLAAEAAIEVSVAQQLANQAAAQVAANGGSVGGRPVSLPQVYSGPQYMQLQTGQRIYFNRTIFRVAPFPGAPVVSKEVYDNTTPTTVSIPGTQDKYYTYDQYVKEYQLQKSIMENKSPILSLGPATWREYKEKPEDYSDGYLQEVQRRISNGQGDINDYNLLDEINRRAKRLMTTSGPSVIQGEPRLEGDTQVLFFYQKMATNNGVKEIGITATFRVANNTLYLEETHIAGAEAGEVGMENLSIFYNQLGRYFGVEKIELQPGVRTTGKMKGQRPSSMTFKVDYSGAKVTRTTN